MILVLGKLGDICKKLSELEILLQDCPDDSFIAGDIAAFRKAIDHWPLANPVTDREDVELLRMTLKINFLKLRELEEDVLAKSVIPETLTEEHFYVMRQALLAYLTLVRTCRSIIGNINALGSIGLLNLPDQDIPGIQENQNEREFNPISDRQQRSSGVSHSESEGIEMVSVIEQRNSEA